ncbi:MAG: hypothetical protein ABIQ95_12765 [Bdellovibrionia bacterium]
MKIEHLSSDLAPGDSSSGSFDWSKYEVRRISSAQDPLFEVVYKKLWEEFGAKGEIEEKSILLQRLQWDPSQFKSDYSLKYEIIVATQDGKFAAVRDSSVIIRRGATPRAIVHLSHALIDPAHRGSGMAGWLRTWPIQTVRSCFLAVGLPSDTPITLVAEMEPHLSKNIHDKGARFKSYRRAGYKMIDPTQVPYLQPDFRSPDIIDKNGGPRPILLQLVMRRIGKESENTLSGSEVRETVSALYQMYGTHFRPKDMLPLWEQLRNYYPSDETRVNLIEPGVGPTRDGHGNFPT